jgi:hypothetical protein
VDKLFITSVKLLCGAPTASHCPKHERTENKKLRKLYTVVGIKRGRHCPRKYRVPSSPAFCSPASVSLCHIAYIISVPKCLCRDRDSSPSLWRPDQMSNSEQSTMVKIYCVIYGSCSVILLARRSAVVGRFEAFVSEPEDVEAGLVTIKKPACPHFFIHTVST